MTPTVQSLPHPRRVFRGEFALCIIAVLNSFAVYLMLYSGAGISSISSVPYIISEVLPVLSLGTWTYLFQTSLVAVLMLLRRKFVPQLSACIFGGLRLRRDDGCPCPVDR